MKSSRWCVVLSVISLTPLAHAHEGHEHPKTPATAEQAPAAMPHEDRDADENADADADEAESVKKAQNQAESEDVEEVDALDSVEDLEAEETTQKGPLAVFGYFHPAFVHMPIAWVMLLLFVDFLTFIRGIYVLRESGRWLGLFTWAALVMGVLSGLARLSTMSLADDSLEAALAHRNALLTAAVFLTGATAMRWRLGSRLSGGMAKTYVALIAVTTAFIAWGGHLGGEMIFGEPPF